MLLDSSVFIRWGRQGQDATAILKPFLRRGELMTCGVVRAEVLRGARLPSTKIHLSTLFSTLTKIVISSEVWERTILLAWTLDRKGKVLPLPDFIIAACALEADVPILTFDGHFNEVPDLTVYSELP